MGFINLQVGDSTHILGFKYLYIIYIYIKQDNKVCPVDDIYLKVSKIGDGYRKKMVYSL